MIRSLKPPSEILQLSLTSAVLPVGRRGSVNVSYGSSSQAGVTLPWSGGGGHLTISGGFWLSPSVWGELLLASNGRPGMLQDTGFAKHRSGSYNKEFSGPQCQ